MSIKAFAGEDYERARYYGEDDAFLLEREEFVTALRSAGGQQSAFVSRTAQVTSRSSGLRDRARSTPTVIIQIP